jgi:hypothetical protein
MADTPELPAWGAESRAVALAVNKVLRGKSNNAGRVTLVASTLTTTVSTKICETTSKVVLFPESANAAAELGNGTMYVSQRLAGSFLIAHANNAQTDRIFSFVIVG